MKVPQGLCNECKHFFLCFISGKVAKEVMEQSAKIKRDPPEIHRSEFLLNPTALK